MEAMLHIGASEKSVLAAKKSILEIMNVENKTASENVKVTALSVLKDLCSVNGTTVSNCIFKEGVTEVTKQPFSLRNMFK